MLQSAIQIAGDGGARIKLDVDDSGIDAIMALSALRGELLRVTVEAESEISSQSEDGESKRNRRAKSRRTRTQSEGAATQ